MSIGSALIVIGSVIGGAPSASANSNFIELPLHVVVDANLRESAPATIIAIVRRIVPAPYRLIETASATVAEAAPASMTMTLRRREATQLEIIVTLQDAMQGELVHEELVIRPREIGRVEAFLRRVLEGKFELLFVPPPAVAAPSPLVPPAFVGPPSPPVIPTSTQSVVRRESLGWWDATPRVIGTGAILAGFASVGVGVAFGLVSRFQVSDFRDASTQVDRFRAKTDGEGAATHANLLFAIGGGLLVIGGVCLGLDTLQVFDGPMPMVRGTTDGISFGVSLPTGDGHVLFP